MSFLFDCSFIWPEIRYKSIPTYAIRMLEALPEKEVGNCSVLVRSCMVPFFRNLNPRLRLVIVKYNKFIGRIPKIGYRYNNCIYRMTIRRLDFDCILIFDELRLCNLFFTEKRKVAVVHDLKKLKESQDYNKSYKYYERLFKSCDALIAVSEYTKHDIVKYYGIEEQKISVVYNSVTLPVCSHQPLFFDAKEKYVLYVNTLYPYKNALTLVKAFHGIKDRYHLNLVFVGSPTDYWDDKVMGYIRDNELEERIVRVENLTPEELKFVYEHATLFVTTSIHEGFGYTPIEAAMCKCPVISSTCEALPETTCKMVYYYEPAQDATALMKKMAEVLDNPPSEEKLSDTAHLFQSCYSPQKQVEGILSVMSNHKN